MTEHVPSVFRTLLFIRYSSKFSFCNILVISDYTLSALQTKTDNFANSVDPDETAHNEPSHQDLHCLPSFWQQWIRPNVEMEESVSENQS